MAGRYFLKNGVWTLVVRLGVAAARVVAAFGTALFDTDTYASSVDVPTAPLQVAGSSTSTSTATITWLPPQSEGGTPVTGYVVSCDDAALNDTATILTAAATDRSRTVTGLNAGATYNLAVAAVNAAGTGPSAAQLVTVQTSGTGLPSAPLTGGAYAPSTTQATIVWNPPASDGGSPVTGYRVSRDGVATSGTGAYTSNLLPATQRSFTMNLLYSGRTYNLSVVAVTTAGSGPAYTESVLIPSTAPAAVPPDIPTNITRTSSSPTTATIAWAAPASDGGATVTGYRVTRDGPDGGQTTTTTALTYTFTGLTSGYDYFLSVSAVNLVGEGVVSTDDVIVQANPTGPTAPSVPTSVTGSSPSTSQATINWQPPTSDGGSALTGYIVSRDGTATSGTGAYTSPLQATTARSFTMNLLSPGTPYNLSVLAVNAVGNSPLATVSVTVQAANATVPTIPTSVTRTSPSSSSATITWTAPTSNGGSAITGYKVTRDGTSTTGVGGTTITVAATTLTYTFTSLQAGVTYNLSVAATNANGDGPASVGAVTVQNGGTPTSDPSGQAMPTASLPDWTILFTDDFATDCAQGQFTSVYGSRWRTYGPPVKASDGTYNWGDTSKNGHYDPAIISVTNSVMDFNIRYDSTRGIFLDAGPEPRINGATGARGQTYGRYAFRFRVPAAVDGYKTAWLLWPDSNNSAEGEIDFPEGNLFGGDTIHAYSHDVQGTHSHNAFSANTGVVYVGSGWHTGIIEWRPSGVTYFMDGKNLGTSIPLGTPVTPMHWILQTETRLSGGAPPTTANGHVQCAWVAVWKYTPGTP